ncbi:hypothetical protein D9M72_486360 [compost metagenome]
MVPGADRRDREDRTRTGNQVARRHRQGHAARAQEEGLLRPSPGQAAQDHRHGHPREAPRPGRAPGLQARGHLRGRVRDQHRLHVLDLRGRVRSRPDGQEEDHGARRRSQPHRPGHRVRLLLRARRARHARRRLRDHHGQLQPRDRVDRLRHLRPPVLRAAHARRRAGDRRQGKAARRDRAVRRPDAVEARARPRGQWRADHRHLARHDRRGRRP